MKTKFKVTLAILIGVALLAWAGVYISTQNMGVLNPKGLISVQQRQLMIHACLLMLIVVIPVFVLTAIFACRYRKGNAGAKYTPEWEHSALAETIWWGIPFLIIIVMAFLTWNSSHKLNPFKPLTSDVRPLKIQVVALDWKWLFIYPEEGIATVNYLNFPEKTPLNFEITADAPMNSFWIPQLGGQIYAMPAMRSKLHLMANETGVFRGSSANLSGEGFAGMVFQATSLSQEDYENWAKQVRGSSKKIDFSSYQILAAPSEYNPQENFRLEEPDLFTAILNKYAPPTRE